MGLPTVTRQAFSRVLGVAALVVAGWALPLAMSPFGLDGSLVLAQEQQQKGKETTRRTPALRNEVYEKLSVAQQAAEANKFAEAKTALDALVREYSGKKQLNSYELANVYNFYAFIYYSQENYQEAIRSYEKVLAQQDIPEAMAATREKRPAKFRDLDLRRG